MTSIFLQRGSKFGKKWIKNQKILRDYRENFSAGFLLYLKMEPPKFFEILVEYTQFYALFKYVTICRGL